MQDIRKPSRSLKYNNQSSRTAPTIKLSRDSARSDSLRVGSSYFNNKIDAKHVRDLKSRVENFENSDQRDFDYENDNDNYENNSNSAKDKSLNRQDFYSNYRDSNKKSVASHRPGYISKISFFKRNKNKILFTFIILSALFLYTFVFNSASITITPKTVDKKIKNNYTISNTEKAKAFEYVTLEKTIEKEIPRSEKKKIISKAEGFITVYNNFSSETQKLIKNTRFESKEGKVFRISDTITVPGKNGNTPGKIEIRVTADSVGEEYNVAAGKFSIPGFKGSSRYGSFYGETTSPMSGGANSEKSVIAKQDIDIAINDMTIEVKEKIKQELSKTVKENYTPVLDDISYSIRDNLREFESGKDDKFKLFAKAEMLMINNVEVAKTLIKKEELDYNGEDVYIKNIQDLKMRYIKDLKATTTNPSNVSIYVEGIPTFVYSTDMEKLKQDMSGKKNSDDTFSQVLSDYPTISSAKSKIYPFWTSTYPSNKNKIKVTEELN